MAACGGHSTSTRGQFRGGLKDSTGWTLQKWASSSISLPNNTKTTGTIKSAHWLSFRCGSCGCGADVIKGHEGSLSA